MLGAAFGRNMCLELRNTRKSIAQVNLLASFSVFRSLKKSPLRSGAKFMAVLDELEDPPDVRTHTRVDISHAVLPWLLVVATFLLY